MKVTAKMTLRNARRVLGLSQQQLAAHTGLSQVQISHIERGKCFPNKSTQRKLAGVLGEVDWEGTFLEF